MQNTNIPHSITLQNAIELTARYRENVPADMPLSETFEKNSVQLMLNATGAEKMRIYYGRKENGEICAVLIAADEEGHDILPVAAARSGGEDEELILEDSFRCPEACPPPSPLNQN